MIIIPKREAPISKKNAPKVEPSPHSIFAYASYSAFVKDRIESSKTAEGRGVTRRLADAMQCHTTFVSQVINRKAGFSNEQALKFCRFFRLDSSETEYFIELLGLERAGDENTRAFFRARVKRLQVQQSDLKHRWSNRNSLLAGDELTYFGSWMTQAVHATLQLHNCNSVEAIARYLGVAKAEVQFAFETLEKMGLAIRVGANWKTTTHFLHLGKDSPVIRHFHLQWRHRVCQNFLKNTRPGGFHYSGALTFAESDEPLIREILLQALDTVMKTVEPSPAETAYALNLDFYPLGADRSD